MCENCGIELPPESTEARICSFECTFCAACVTDVLHNVCPNCGGGFSARPVRPATRWKGENYLGGAPAATKRIVRPVDAVSHGKFAEPLMGLPPHKR